VVRTALENAVTASIESDRPKSKPCFPILPLLQAGDDLWILCRRDLAFPLALRLGEEFARLAASDPIISLAVEIAGQKPLSMSLGLLFAKKGFPFDAQLDLAEELERSAKNYRRELGQAKGCVDFHWLESSGRESIADARNHGYGYKDTTESFWLTTRPWTLEEASALVTAAIEVKSLPRRKRHQLDEVLRRGAKLSDLAYLRWRQGLTGVEQKSLDVAVALLPNRLRPSDSGPWTKTGVAEYHTALLDLTQLAEILPD
jgi:hypothetical protein